MIATGFFVTGIGRSQETPQWKYSAEVMQPFWLGDSVASEPILFVRDAESGEARGSLMFAAKNIVSVKSSSGDTTYQEGRDYLFAPGSREIVVPSNSRMVTCLASDLRRPANSQKHKLTHRDGNGEIMFGANLEYHQLQTWVTYGKQKNEWPVPMPVFDRASLPVTLQKLRDGERVTIVLLGDSISTGCNASGWGKAAPFQPAYQDLLLQHLQAHYRSEVKLLNLSVGGMSTPWGVTMTDQVAELLPDLVILAFGMNDSAGRSPQEYGQNTEKMIAATRDKLPQAEFILIASMLGNRDWTLLKHEVFPEYRHALAELCRPGVALADMSSVWQEMLHRKKDSDLTGNGVNHPNDFGHRVYAQVLSSLLVDGN